MFNLKKKEFKKFDWLLFLSVAFLSIYGLFVLYSAFSGDILKIRSQLVASILGFLFIILICTMDMDVIKKGALPIYVISLILLLLTIFLGQGEQQWGSNSWLILGPIQLQPSEITKVGIIFSLAAYLEKYKEDINKPSRLLLTLMFAGLPVLFILLQPDFGTAMVYIFFIAIMLFSAGLSWKWILALLALASIGSLILILNLEGYRADRIHDFLDPSRDTSGSGWQQQQGLIAIGSGMFKGRGFMKGTQAQYGYIPEKETDYIFSVLAEELGFIGAILMLIAFIIMIYRLLIISKNSKNSFISLMTIGICAMFFVHIFENVAMTIGLMPVTGIPLPFFSSGGTFLLICFVNIGLALSASMQKSTYDIEDTSEYETLKFKNKRVSKINIF
ncbi:MAG: rod shape-determining protein RodA [Anaerococcus hydrogenalis]|uniref:rod shape-determining protein RodA n=1 Tax=Anaerococcus hydrogenalis TaxID=33029 RepID=UPI0029010819|nr:rod shape-determining protein RodA [Anaerococcus hydrogenalis]MDU2582293.1 rod shape-determining protein RodA [Anaerococcus hydrogenalis]